MCDTLQLTQSQAVPSSAIYLLNASRRDMNGRGSIRKVACLNDFTK
jgi:hypothetical protein